MFKHTAIMLSSFKAFAALVAKNFISSLIVVDYPSAAIQGFTLQVDWSVVGAPIHLGSSPLSADPSVSRYEQEAPRNSEPHYLPPDLLRANLLRRAERRVVLNFAGKPCRIPWRTFPVYEATLMPSLRLESTKSIGKLLETEKEAQECPSMPISQKKPAVPWKMISPPPVWQRRVSQRQVDFHIWRKLPKRHWQGLATAYQSDCGEDAAGYAGHAHKVATRPCIKDWGFTISL
ncbi:hypothetical protein RUND412_008156 [Rhizina undulata]